MEQKKTNQGKVLCFCSELCFEATNKRIKSELLSELEDKKDLLINTTGEERQWAWLRNCFKRIVSQVGYFLYVLWLFSEFSHSLMLWNLFLNLLLASVKLLTDSYSTLFWCAKAATLTLNMHPMRCRHWRKLTNDRERIQNRNYYAASGGIPRISMGFHRSK